MLKVRLGNEDKFEIEQYQYNAQIMGDVNLTCDIFLSSEEAVFDLDMYVNINNENLYLTSAEPTGEKNNTNTLEKYTLYFESKRVELKRKYFRDLTSNGTGVDWGTSFSFYGNIYDFADRLQMNLDKYFGIETYIITELPEGYPLTKLLFTADNLYLFDALNTMSEIYGLEWRISAEGDTFNIEIDPEEVILTHIFEYEGGNIGKGLTLIQKNIDTSNIVTRMLSAGSTKNIPYGYFRDYSEQGYLRDMNIAPDFAIGFFNLMPKCFRDYIRGYNYYPYTPRPEDIGNFAYEKGYRDKANGVYNPLTYYEANVSKWGVREGIVEVNEDIFPTITDVQKDGLGYVDEVVAVEQVNFDNEEAYEEYDDTDNIFNSYDYWWYSSSLNNTIASGNTYLSISADDEVNMLILKAEQYIYFDVTSKILIQPNSNNLVNSEVTLTLERQNGLVWDEETSFIFPLNRDNKVADELYSSDISNFSYLIPTNGVFRFSVKIDVNLLNPNPIALNVSHIIDIHNLRVTNSDYGKKKPLDDINHILMCVNANNSSVVYSPNFFTTEQEHEVYIPNARLTGKIQYDRDIPNENNQNGILMFDCSVILQKEISSGVWTDYEVKKFESEFTPIDSFIVGTNDSILPTTGSAWVAGNIVAEKTMVFSSLMEGTYRLKTVLSISKKQIGSITPLPTFVRVELKEMYYTLKGYKPTFYVWIKDVFDLTQENLYLTGVDPQINFTTGNLAGDEYVFSFDPAEVIEDNSKSLSGVPSKWRLTCYKSEADKEATGFAIPNTRKQGNAGDKFIFLGINMPYDPYVLTAEQKLEDYVKDELNKVSDVKRDFSLTLYDPFISGFSDKENLLPSNYIKVKHDALIEGILQVQIKGVTITQNKGAVYPTYSLELSDKSSITPIKRRGVLGRLEDTTDALLRDTQIAFKGLREVSGSVKRKADNTISESRYSLSKGIGSNAHVLIGGVEKEVSAIKETTHIFNNYDDDGNLNVHPDLNIDLELENNVLKAIAIRAEEANNNIYHTGAKGYEIKAGETITFKMCIYTGISTNRDISLVWTKNPDTPESIGTENYTIQNGSVLNYITWEYTAIEDIVLNELRIDLNGFTSLSKLGEGDSFKILLSKTKLFLGTESKKISASYNDTQADIINIYNEIKYIRDTLEI